MIYKPASHILERFLFGMLINEVVALICMHWNEAFIWIYCTLCSVTKRGGGEGGGGGGGDWHGRVNNKPFLVCSLLLPLQYS
jgi:hypothetical protein